MRPHRRSPRIRLRSRGTLVPLLAPDDPATPRERDVALYVQEAVTRQMVEDLIEEVREVRDRITTLFVITGAGILVEIFTRLYR